MTTIRPHRDTHALRVSAHTPLRFLLALLFVCACGAASARGQVRPPELSPSRQQQQHSRQQSSEKKGTPADDEEEDDGVGGGQSASAGVFGPPRVTDPATILRRARFVFVRSDSAFISGREVEDSLRKRKEFQAWGMVITRNEAEADLVVEITRKPLTRRFTFSVIDPRSAEVVASGKTRSVLFGKKIANKVAEKFANRVKVYRPLEMK